MAEYMVDLPVSRPPECQQLPGCDFVEGRGEMRCTCADVEPLRAAAYIMAAMLPKDLLMPPYRKDDALKALAGDLSGLYVWERQAVYWLERQVRRDPGTVLNAWTAAVLDACRKLDG